jgi:hypothetical protein
MVAMRMIAQGGEHHYGGYVEGKFSVEGLDHVRVGGKMALSLKREVEGLLLRSTK